MDNWFNCRYLDQRWLAVGRTADAPVMAVGLSDPRHASDGATVPIFQIPEDLSIFTASALTQMSTQAVTEYNTLLTSLQEDPTLATAENRADLSALRQFTLDAKAEKESRELAAKELAEHAPLAIEGDEPVADKAEEEFAAPSVGEVAPHTPAIEGEIVEPGQFGRMFAAANLDKFPMGSELKDLKELTEAFLSKVRTFPSLGTLHNSEPVTYTVATLTRDYPSDLSVFGDDRDLATLDRVTDETRLPGGSLLRSLDQRRQQLAKNPLVLDSMVAATGWCAPSETLYDTCFQGVIDGLLDVPEVQARRGGIRHNQGIDFTGVFGAGTGFFNLSEAQVISGTAKTCIEIPCPSFVDDRLGVTGICITGNILQNRGYPEFVKDWMRAAMVVSAHQINSLQIADVVSGSTAVVLAAAPWTTDLTVTSQLLAAVEMAIVDMKYRLRMSRNATLDVVFPWWVLAQFRADLSRQNGGDALARQNVTDAQINSWFSTRNARVQWVYDWQDAFAPTDVIGAAGNAPGSATAIQQFPTGVKFLIYPTGTWVRAVNDVITLNAIYDSTKLVTNQNTQLFTETGWKMMRMCPLSRVYTVNICPSGSTGDQRAVDCS
jgi:hypothetical protein